LPLAADEGKIASSKKVPSKKVSSPFRRQNVPSTLQPNASQEGTIEDISKPTVAIKGLNKFMA
jgi:hypothetical protein